MQNFLHLNFDFCILIFKFSVKQFQVPQFITIEDKIFGPLTLKQFVYLLGGGSVAMISYMLNFFLFLIIGLPIGIFSALLAFFEYNGQPFPKIVYGFINYQMKPKLYIWKSVPPSKKPGFGDKISPSSLPTMNESKLSDLSWNLDVTEKSGR